MASYKKSLFSLYSYTCELNAAHFLALSIVEIFSTCSENEIRKIEKRALGGKFVIPRS